MLHRIEVKSKIKDTRGSTFTKKIVSFGFKVHKTAVIDVYTLNKSFSSQELDLIGTMLTNPVVEEFWVDLSTPIEDYDWAVEVGYLPGVTDNVASTIKEEIEGSLKTEFQNQEGVYSSRLFLIKGDLNRENIEDIALAIYNPLIQRAQIKSQREYVKDNGMGIVIPQVKLHQTQEVDLVDLNLSESELEKIGKSGIANKDGSRRGPLALDLNSMLVIKKYFAKQKRKPTDIELESVAQTWSEHCKHTIFAASLDEVKKGLYKEYIKAATQKIRKDKGKKDICVSVFVDNSGAIIFDKDYLITDKVETHNSPSALDPFGGAITGIVGVNRDTIGFGRAAKPVINRYGFCFADPRDERLIYKSTGKKNKMLSPRRIMEGVIDGVNVGGNCSGIPTPQGFVYFDERYRGKPLVFVGTVGLIPRKIGKTDSCQKKAEPGDLIVMVGGRVGADGIHGATFSSEALSSGSPATAVQIGDPITQKKLSDAIVKEARDLNLYNSITDNGAGGLSCSVAEMAKESGGCEVELDLVPLKYPGLSPWEIWISESQERMTLSISEEKWPEFKKLMHQRGVEATMIGKFTNSGKCIVNFHGKKIMDIQMEFLHNGLPEKHLKSLQTKKEYPEPKFDHPENLNQTFLNMLSRLNLGSFEFISNQYDYEVQGGSVLKPLQGPGRINGSASVTRPNLNSSKAVVLSQALYPSYSEFDAYQMAACSIDTAIRNVIAVGGNLNHLALLDNFCWCSSNDPERLGQLKAAVRACYDYSIGFGTPFISGKDSMFNDFVGYDEDDKQVSISIPPTLLISSIGVIENAKEVIDLAVKMPGDLIYLIGETKEELLGSEYFSYLCEKSGQNKYEIGGSVPNVDWRRAKKTYLKVSKAIKDNLLSSAISLGSGGLGLALAKTAIAGEQGILVDLRKIKTQIKRNDYILFSESQSRLLVTIAPQNRNKFEETLKGINYCQIGKVENNDKFEITGIDGNNIINTNINQLEKSYKQTLKDY